jgi:hypothetical protein
VTGNERCLIRAEIDHRIGDLFRLGQAPHGVTRY